LVEEVSGVGTGNYAGVPLRTVWTSIIRIGKANQDIVTTKCILAAENGETASYVSEGKLILGAFWSFLERGGQRTD
jgi:hypothetical protein